MIRDVDMHDAPTVMRQQDHDEQLYLWQRSLELVDVLRAPQSLDRGEYYALTQALSIATRSQMS